MKKILFAIMATVVLFSVTSCTKEETRKKLRDVEKSVEIGIDRRDAIIDIFKINDTAQYRIDLIEYLSEKYDIIGLEMSETYGLIRDTKLSIKAKRRDNLTTRWKIQQLQKRKVSYKRYLKVLKEEEKEILELVIFYTK